MILQLSPSPPVLLARERNIWRDFSLSPAFPCMIAASIFAPDGASV